MLDSAANQMCVAISHVTDYMFLLCTFLCSSSFNPVLRVRIDELLKKFYSQWQQTEARRRNEMQTCAERMFTIRITLFKLLGPDSYMWFKQYTHTQPVLS